jgi:hypothetical protein
MTRRIVLVIRDILMQFISMLMAGVEFNAVSSRVMEQFKCSVVQFDVSF